jgi:hypothetical protein
MIHFAYTLHDHGWAALRAVFDRDEFEFRVSYMSDALEDLVSAVVALLSGEPVVRFALIDEPGEHCWTLQRDGDRLRGTVVHLKRMYRTQCFNAERVPGQPRPEDEGEAVASFECSLRELAEAVARMVRDIDARYREADFKRTRNPGIPPDLVARLNTMIA